jgi:RNA polymerase sigma-70 factor, ECF subfamily
MSRNSDQVSREEAGGPSVVSLDDARWRRRADELVLQHREYLQGLARRLCRNHYDPEDLVQDVLEKTMRSPNSIPPGANERAWLSRVLHNLFIDRVRRKTARREEPIEAEPVMVAPVEGAWWESITVADIRAKLPRLPSEQRETFELFAFEGRSYDEIAAQLGIAKATVGTRILRARMKLRDLLGKERRDG